MEMTMPKNVKKPYSYAEARAAIDRSNGQPLGSGANDPSTRQDYNATGKKLGHEYMHRGGISKYEDQGDHPSGLKPLKPLQANQLAKSRAENRETSYRLTEYLLNTPQVQAALDDADNGVAPVQKWLKNVPVTVDYLYGFESGGTISKQITAAAINFRKIGDELFIASVYPVAFQGERNFELDLLFS
jgi:hypothetical protein